MVLVELLGASAPTKPEDNPNWAMSTGLGGGGIGHARAIGRLSVPPEQIINHKVGAGLAPAPVGQIILDSNGRNGRKRGKPRFSQNPCFPPATGHNGGTLLGAPRNRAFSAARITVQQATTAGPLQDSNL